MLNAGLAAVIALSLGCEAASCRELFVERVAGCTQAHMVFHRHVGVHPLRCENRLLGDGFNELSKYYHAREFDPECDTISVADGVGMRGIAPALCVAMTGGVRIEFPVKLPDELLRPVAVLRNASGFDVGTGILVTPDVLLTAHHVVRPAKLQNIPVVAAFDVVQTDACRLTSLDEEVSFLLPQDSRFPKTLVQSSDEELDYAFLKIEPREISKQTTGKLLPAQVLRARRAAEGCSLLKYNPIAGSLPSDFNISPMPLDVAAIRARIPMGSAVIVAGFTRNVFFPRGMLVSNGGVFVAARPDIGPTSIHYNAQTAPGFSGGPIFDDTFRWVGMHTYGYSHLGADEAVKSGVFRDFARPNGGHRLKRVLADMATCIRLHGMPDWLDKTALLEAIRAMPKNDADACTWRTKQ